MGKRKRLPHTRLLHLTGTHETGYRFTDMHRDATVLTLEVVRPDTMREYFYKLFADRIQGDRLHLTAADIQQIRRDHRSQLAA